MWHEAPQYYIIRKLSVSLLLIMTKISVGANVVNLPPTASCCWFEHFKLPRNKFSPFHKQAGILRTRRHFNIREQHKVKLWHIKWVIKGKIARLIYNYLLFELRTASCNQNTNIIIVGTGKVAVFKLKGGETQQELISINDKQRNHKPV